jgi:hypothetical protein
MKKIILKWLGLDTNGEVVRTIIPEDERMDGGSVNHRIGIIKTINGGCVLEIATYKVTSSKGGFGHNDWTYEFYTVGENQKISEAVGVVLLMKGLEK